MHANNGIKTMQANATISVSVAHSSFGTPQPEIAVRYPRGTHFRAVRAALFALAARVENATPRTESWVVEVDAGGDLSGRVYLDLVDADEAETQRGLAVLREVAGGR
jgi:hypothetical protein